MDAKALLDSLMGASRNQDLKEQKKNKGQNFKKDNICKNFLLGFCPAHELFDTKLSRFKGAPVSACTKTHSEAMKLEFEAHKDHATLKIEYERDLLRAVERYVKDADASAEKERAQVKRNEVEIPGSVHVKKMPKGVEEEIAGLTKDMNGLMEAAEESAEKGDIEGSKFKVTLADEIKTKIEELKNKFIVSMKYKQEHVCDVCGQRLEAFDPKNPQRYQAHFDGTVHNLYIKIRDWYKTLKAKTDPGDDRRGRSRSRSRSRSRRRRSPSTERRGGQASREQSNAADVEKDRPRDSYDEGRSRPAAEKGEQDQENQDRHKDRDYSGYRDRDRPRDQKRDRRRAEDQDRFREQERGGDRGDLDRGRDRDRYGEQEQGGHQGDRYTDRDPPPRRDRDRYGEQEQSGDRGYPEARDALRDQDRGRDRRDRGEYDRHTDRDRRDRGRFREQERGGDRGFFEDRDRFRDQERSGYRGDQERYADRDYPKYRDQDSFRDQERGGDRGYRDRYGDQERGRDRDWGYDNDAWRERSRSWRG